MTWFELFKDQHPDAILDRVDGLPCMCPVNVYGDEAGKQCTAFESGICTCEKAAVCWNSEAIAYE